MNRKMMWIAGAMGLVLAVAGIAGGVRYFEMRNAEPLMEPENESYVVGQSGGAELIAEVEDEDEAQKLAELYGITLLRVNAGLAVFETEEDPASVINRGIENGWKELSMNTVYYFDDVQNVQIQ